MNYFDYVKPEIIDFASRQVKGDSCYIDCTEDSLCPGDDDEI